MRLRLRPSWVIVALGLVVAACGTAEPDQFTLRTPDANTGAPLAPTAIPSPVPSATATPKAKPSAKRKPVTNAERKVIRGWSEELRHGRVTAASRYFSIPSLVVNATPDWEFLDTRDAIKNFNRGLPCGAKLIRTRRSTDDFVVGIFRLTERPGAGECGTGTGNIAAVAFLIQKQHITRWVRVAEDAPSPSATPTPTATATPDDTATPTPTATPEKTATPVPTNELGFPELA